MDKITLLGSGGGEPTSYIILICKRQPPPCSCPTPSWLGWRKSPLLYEPREKLHRPDASPTAVEKTWGDCSANVGEKIHSPFPTVRKSPDERRRRNSVRNRQSRQRPAIPPLTCCSGRRVARGALSVTDAIWLTAIGRPKARQSFPLSFSSSSRATHWAEL